jgi:hypothetical protein
VIGKTPEWKNAKSAWRVVLGSYKPQGRAWQLSLRATRHGQPHVLNPNAWTSGQEELLHPASPADDAD